ncbi:cytochrome C [Lacisediminimonas profundi]|uniref:cytochrome C n=1 Tax=Lacisediminimonas profundi TaxID=2603856 RepID=UPI00124B17B4|nr:cytochrome C [Lacisediminimonas profundi]
MVRFARSALCVVIAASTLAHAAPGKEKSIARGRYLVEISGCNDCHTPGFAMSGGKVPEKEWLTGDQLGWQGPWGTTYPPNLRLSLQKMSEQEWIKFARTAELRPPMPFWALRTMKTEDLRAIHRYVKTLAPAGDPAPAYLPPGQEAKGPVVKFPAPPK